MMDLLHWILAFFLFVVQYFLSRREKAYWGGLVPLGFVIFMIVIYARDNFDDTSSFIFATLGGLAITCSIWDNGRKALKLKRKKELEKIELQDI